ncbi:BRCT domain-containing protein At4g02110 [Vigna unguiculata]|uniref:BRCT domain-containing protein At4g02110 n=1 Tax=Vigna unguiculata TaxID=3917 RepID=UPI0010160A71|nr:BRCT domain-containing protein At4g02110 [Vigna unguiculata]
MMEASYASRVFRGVRFVLRGFNPAAESQIRVKLEDGGGIDAGQYGGSCSHVIVDKIAYDDPLCVAARKDRKAVVTALWVDHSADIGMPVDASSVMYRPPKDLDGIPGAKDLIMCLTGYLRQDRDDIMTMVGLMGAKFSKPLVANKVTHLICYKFEGEKYLLAKRLGTIKLVNHRWLEDCLKEWVLLPEDKYNKSGFELEMTEEEAKDSEEEGEDAKLGQSGGRNIQQSPLGSKFAHAANHGLLKSVREASSNLPDSTGPRVLPNVNNGEDSLTIPESKRKSDQDSSFYNVDDSKISYQTPDISKLPDKYTNTTESKNADYPKALGCQDPGNTANTKSSVQRSGLHGNTTESKKLINELTSTSASAAGVAHSNEKLRTTSYSRKNQREFSVPRILDGSSGIEGNRCENSKADEEIQFMKSTSLDISGRGNDFTKGDEPISLLPQKRINEASSTKLKSRKVSSDAKVSIQSANGKSQGLKVTSQVDEPPKAGSNSNSVAFDEHFSRNAGPESAQRDSVYQNSPQSAIRSISESKINGKPDVTSSGLRQVGCDEAGLHITKSLDSSSKGNKNSHDVESGGCTNLDLSNEECNKLVRKSPTKKSVVKGISGSKPRVSATARHKRSLSLNKTNLGEGVALCSESKEICDAKIHQGCPQNRDINNMMEQEAVTKNTDDASDRADFFTDETEAPDDKCEFEFGMALNEESVHPSEKPNRATKEKSETICPATKCEEAMPPKKCTNKAEIQKTSSLLVKNQARECAAGKANATVSKYADDASDRTETLDDETEDPDDKLENELGMTTEEELVNPSKKRDKSTKVHPSKKRDKSSKEKPEAICPASKCEDAMPPKGVTNKTEKQKPSSLVVKHQARKRPAGKAKATVAKDLSKSKVAVSKEKVPNETGDEAEIETVEEVPSPADQHDKSALARNKSVTLAEEEKENRPIDLMQDPVKGRSNDNPTNKSDVRSTNIKSTKVGLNPSISESNTRVKTEAAFFILSGHRLQRKEFQQVIKRLKGRVCRDSHQWSYQATHFIAPDPLRRVEKFFAAAASGRWILKMDYLTDSSQEGKLLAEEPYEWHRNGLSEDGAINMEAPRKWRLVKEKTGHGAFYGMRIVVYGDCIAPPLDTLKRVIKAGDGTILATSPPYTRFLGTGVDYAVVSPGMPHVDIWVQEFLKHEIPCVVADYLVEYVCKPGFSLEKHVLYGTHSWAEKSLDKLKSKAEEIVAPEDFSDDDDSDDVPCQVCGSRDRGDVMLICGDESGSVGCGVGTHIDCCDPPLTQVPEDDWFCSKCSTTPNSSKSSTKRKKNVLS